MKVALALLALLLLLGVIGTMSHQDQIDDDNYYCEMVRSGAWPAYKGTEVCQ